MKPHHAKGLCMMHLARKRRTGRVGPAGYIPTGGVVAERNTGHLARTLQTIVKNCGSLLVMEPVKRGTVALIGKHGRKAVSLSKLHAWRQRGWVVLEPAKENDRHRSWRITPEGREEAENHAPRTRPRAG